MDNEDIVWVVCQNDFPVAVFSNKELGLQWMRDQLSKGASLHLHCQGPFKIDSCDPQFICKKQ